MLRIIFKMRQMGNLGGGDGKNRIAGMGGFLFVYLAGEVVSPAFGERFDLDHPAK